MLLSAPSRALSLVSLIGHGESYRAPLLSPGHTYLCASSRLQDEQRGVLDSRLTELEGELGSRTQSLEDEVCVDGCVCMFSHTAVSLSYILQYVSYPSLFIVCTSMGVVFERVVYVL